ncbi:hypothetical protein JCM10213_007871 [Rhodosporidiobolus nylandii]
MPYAGRSAGTVQERPLFSYVHETRLFDGAWEDLVAAVSQNDTGLPEWRRSWLVALANVHVQCCGGFKPPFNPFELISVVCEGIYAFSPELDGREVFRLANSFLRQYLVLLSLANRAATRFPPSRRVSAELFIRSTERTLHALRLADMSQEAKAKLAVLIQKNCAGLVEVVE